MLERARERGEGQITIDRANESQTKKNTRQNRDRRYEARSIQIMRHRGKEKERQRDKKLS